YSHTSTLPSPLTTPRPTTNPVPPYLLAEATHLATFSETPEPPPGLEPNFKEDPNAFTFHLSFTISNFANKPHKENDASPFTFFMWIPIKQTTGNLVEENFEVKGGEFVFPDDSCGIKFSGFNGI
ncbi:hypothetical protein VP01_8415g1, partial [Puccinia sorghi]